MANKKPVKKTNNNRPGQYDWFKTGTEKSKGSTPKGSAKTIWKFVKIFLFISLFGFTMTGCVQSFVFKSDTNIGRSVEIFANSDEVAPHTTTINVNSKDAKKIYLEYTDSNHWINERETPNILGQIRKAIKSQNASKNLKMQDAWHGKNEVLRFTVDGIVDKGTDAIIQSNKKPMVISTLSTTNNYNDDITTLVKEFKKYKFLTKDSKGIETIDFKWLIDDPKHPRKPTKEDKARDQFNVEAFTYLMNQPEVQKALTSKVQVNKPLTKAQHEEYLRISNNFLVIAKYFGVTNAYDKATKTNYWAMPHGYMVGAGTSSPWRPQVTWSDSWKLGPFYALFVYPIGVITANMIQVMPFMDGWESLITIFIIVFIIKALSFLITFKSILQQTKMQELSAKKAIIDAKYANYKENKQMQQRKQQEVQALYKKEGISPLGSMGAMFIVMPLFFSILRVTRALPHLKSTLWLGIRFGATSWRELFHGSWQYLPLMLLAMTFAGVQQILPRLLTKRRDKNRMNVHQKAAMKKNNKIQNITIIVSIVASVIFSAGMQVYYLASGSWMIIQAFLTHHILVQQKKKRRIKKIKT